MDRPFQPHRALLHPLWLGAALLLAVNDQWWKGSGLLPGWLTGKLSDFAGLLVAPVVLAALLRLSRPRTLVAAHVATGSVFAAIKLSTAAAGLLEALTALTPFPWHITVDPTDLAALPMLFVSYHFLVPAMRRPREIHPLVHRAVLAAGVLACVATSQDPCAQNPEGCQEQPPLELASLVLGNTTDTERLIRVRPLRDSVAVDCDVVAADPSHALSTGLFGPADTWLLQPGRALPLQNAMCDAYLVDADGLPLTLLFWRSTDFPTHLLSTAMTSADPVATIELRRNGTRLELGAHPAVFDPPPADPPQATPQCAVPDLSVGVDWSGPVYGEQPITAITTSPDGCHGFDLNGTVFYLCVPPAAMPFQVGDAVTVTPLIIQSGTYPELTGGHAPEADGVYIRSATHALMAVRGNVLARREIIGDTSLSPFTAEADRASGCPGSHDTCDSLVFPIDVSFIGDHVSGVTFLRPGNSLAFADGYGTLHLVRAEDIPVRDMQCLPFSTNPEESRHYESVLVWTTP